MPALSFHVGFDLAIAENVRRLRDLYHNDKIDAVFLGWLSLIFFSFFFAGTDLQRTLFYVGLPLCLYQIWALGLTSLSRASLILLGTVGAYFFINALSILWSEGMDAEKIIQRSKLIVFLPLCFAAVIPFLQRHDWAWRVLIASFIIAAGVSAPLVLAWGADTILEGRRLGGWGKTENSVMCAMLYTLAFLLMMGRLVIRRGTATRLSVLMTGLSLAAILLTFLVIVLTYSRGPLLAIPVVLLALAVFRKGVNWWLLVLPVAGVMLSVLIMIFFKDYFMMRGSSGRLDIWHHALDLFRQKPWFGHGIGSKFTYDYTAGAITASIGHPHNLYLSAMVHTGIAGLAALLAALAAGLWYGLNAIKQGETSYFILIGFGVFLGLLDFGGYYTNLGVTWILFWLPMMGLIAFQSRGQS